MSGFFNDLTMGRRGRCARISAGVPSAIVSGFMNMIGNLGGVATLIVTSRIMKSTVTAKETAAKAAGTDVSDAIRAGEIEGYIINLSLYALAYAIGVLFWLRIDATKPIIAEDELPRELGDATNTSGENRH